MTNKELEKIIREYVDKTVHMSLGTATKDGRPWVSEVHFTYDDDLNIYWRSKELRRHSQEIAENPHVAGNIVKQHALDEYPHAIYFEGTAELIKDEQKYQEIYELFAKRSIGDESMIEDAKSEDRNHFYKATVENWYAFGKFGRDSGSKYHLPWSKDV